MHWLLLEYGSTHPREQLTLLDQQDNLVLTQEDLVLRWIAGGEGNVKCEEGEGNIQSWSVCRHYLWMNLVCWNRIAICFYQYSVTNIGLNKYKISFQHV